MTQSTQSYALDSSSIPFSPRLAVELGTEATLVIQQIHYWIQKGAGQVIDGTRWIYNTLDDWLKQFTWLSKWILRKAMRLLRERGLVKFCQHEKKQWKRRGWYTIDYELLNLLLHPTCEHITHVDVRDPHTSYIETENTSENTNTDTHPTRPAGKKNSIRKKRRKKRNRIVSTPKKASKTRQPAKTSAKAHIPHKPIDAKTSSQDPVRPDVSQSQEAVTTEIDVLIEEIEDLGVRVNPQIEKVVRLASVQVIKDAIALLRHKQQTHQTLRNPAGFLVRAIENHWKPESSSTSAPEGFGKWFEALRKAGVLLASTLDRATGQLWVFDRNGNRYSYEEMLARFPVISNPVE